MVRAEQLPNRTWRVFVKWQGFADDHITPEPLSQILKTVSDPDLLKQIRTAQDDYLAANPAQRNFVRPEPPAAGSLPEAPAALASTFTSSFAAGSFDPSLTGGIISVLAAPVPPAPLEGALASAAGVLSALTAPGSAAADEEASGSGHCVGRSVRDACVLCGHAVRHHVWPTLRPGGAGVQAAAAAAERMVRTAQAAARAGLVRYRP